MSEGDIAELRGSRTLAAVTPAVIFYSSMSGSFHSSKRNTNQVSKLGCLQLVVTNSVVGYGKYVLWL